MPILPPPLSPRPQGNRPVSRFTARRFLVLLHRYTGLLIALFLIMLGVTGSLLAFTRQIEQLVAPQLFAHEPLTKPRLDLATLATRVEMQEPHAWLNYIFADGPDRVEVDIDPRINSATGNAYALGYDQIFLDPVTGREIGHRINGNIRQGLVNLMPFILLLHSELALGSLGTWVLGIVGLAWTVDCFIGFALAWPQGGWLSWRRWRNVLGVKRNADAFRINYDLHRAGGLWLWPILFVFAWSSVMFNLPGLYNRVSLAALGGSMPDYSDTGLHPNLAPKMDFAAAASCGRALMAQQAAAGGYKVLRPFGIGYLETDGVYTYDAQTTADLSAQSWESNLWMDGDRCILRRDVSPHGKGLAAYVSNLLNALHFADLHGWLPYRIFVSLTGLAVAALSGTGIYIFWRKRMKARRSVLKKRTKKLL